MTRRAELAVQAVALLSVEGARLKAPQLAEPLGSTPGFVAQIIGPLVKAGLVQSTPGPTGGYSLAPDAEQASVLDVIEAIDGPTETGRCVSRDVACGAATKCALHDAWTSARATLISALAATPATRATHHASAS